MKLYLVERTDYVDYDEHDAAVIRADSAQQIVDDLFTLDERGQTQLLYYAENTAYTEDEYKRRLLKHGYNLYHLVGFTKETTIIREITLDGKHEIIIESFRAG